MNAPSEAVSMQPSALPLDHIVPSRTHIQLMRRERFSAPLLQELAASIREIGVLQAIVVRSDRASGGYELVAGERRWLAAKIAGLAEIPATVRELTDEQVLKAQLVENLQREGLHELEEAEGYGELMKLEKITADQVAAMVGKSRSYVFARLKLLALGPEARKAFYTGEIDASRALYVARITNPKLQAKALALATHSYHGGEPAYSARQLRAKLTGGDFSVHLKTAPFARDDASFFELVGKKKNATTNQIPLPDCVSCPNRTGNCLDLFSQDDDPDVCMDPACYGVKVRQHGERLRQQMEAAGVQVITGAEAKKIAPGKGQLAGFVDLDEECDEDEWQEPEPDDDGDDNGSKEWRAWSERFENYQARTFRQLLEGTPVNAIVIEDPHDQRIRTLVPYAEAEKALKKQHKIELSEWNYGVRPQHASQSAGQSAEEREDLKRKQEAQKAREETEMQFRRALLAAVFAKWSGPLKRDDLQAIAERVLDWDTRPVLKPLYDGKEPQPGQMKEAELVRLLAIVPVAEAAARSHLSPKPLLELARRLKIDPDKIKKELKAGAATQKPTKGYRASPIKPAKAKKRK